MERSALNNLTAEWDKETQIVIWGFGMVAMRTIRKISEDFKIPFIIDNNPEKAGKYFMSIPIITFADAISNYNLKDYKIVVTTTARWYSEIKEELIQNGLQEYSNFCSIDQFIPEWYWKNRNKVYLLRIDSVVTTKCTLNCINCNMFIPYYKESENMSFVELKRNADIIFSNIDFIFSYLLIGGEPFLNQDIDEIIEYIFSKYSSQIGRMEIVTNGTIIPNNNTLMILKKYGVEISISDYTAEVNYQEKLKSFLETLCMEGITFYLNKTLDWVDFGFPSAPFSFSDGKEAMKHMHNCSPLFQGINNGRFYYCNVAWSASASNLFHSDNGEYFDLSLLHKDNKESKKRFLEYSLGNIPDGYLQFCKVCGGCGSDNDRYVTAGRQIQK